MARASSSARRWRRRPVSHQVGGAHDQPEHRERGDGDPGPCRAGQRTRGRGGQAQDERDEREVGGQDAAPHLVRRAQLQAEGRQRPLRAAAEVGEQHEPAATASDGATLTPEVAGAEGQAGQAAEAQEARERRADQARRDQRAQGDADAPHAEQQPGRAVAAVERVGDQDRQDARPRPRRARTWPWTREARGAPDPAGRSAGPPSCRPAGGAGRSPRRPAGPPASAGGWWRRGHRR